jgi:plastocyanin
MGGEGMRTATKSILVGLTYVFFHGMAAQAATNTLQIFNFNFGALPSTHIDPIITLGDTVTWVWTNGHHSTTAAPGQLESWDSGVQNTPFTFSHTFSQLGTFNYYCMVHGTSTGCRGVGAMSGIVTVVLTGSPPYQVTGVTMQGSDVLVSWVTGGICQTNILQRATGAADGSYTNNFTDIFTVLGTTGNATNYLDVGASTNFPFCYYRVNVPH